ncbi:MAG: aldo/keto reductase [Bryobacterales bacterium]|nr:aldo/keto reductase [Bryobacterales bacterium]
MNYRLLGRSGLRVSELCLGTMTFGEEWGWGSTEAESRKVFDAFVEAGGNFFDTANGYTNGSSERLLGSFLASERDRYVVATKFSFSTRPGDANAGGNHRKHMVEALEASLKRLGLEYVDLYWMHAWDQFTPVDEVMRALDDLVRAGKILYAGVSDTPAWVVSQANTLAELRGWTRFVGLQLEYSLLERTAERELLPMAQALGLGVTAWGVLGSGILTGKYRNAAREDARRLDKTEFTPLTERNLGIADLAGDVAAELACKPSQLAMAWMRSRPNMIPIIGARTPKQMEDNLGCLGVELPPIALDRLDKATAIDLGFPHEFLRRPFVQNYLHGGLYGRIRRHEG